MNRKALGFMTLGLAIAGVVVSLVRDDTTFGGVLLRAAIVLGAMWLVLPQARNLPRSIWFGVGILGLTVAFRPRLFLFGLGAAFVVTTLAALGGRSRAKDRLDKAQQKRS